MTKMHRYSWLVCFAVPAAYASVLPRQGQPRFRPSPNSGFDDPTVNIASPAFGTAIAEGYQGPFASGYETSLVGPANLLRSGTLQIGVKSNYTLPLYNSINAKGGQYWWVTTDSSDEGNAAQLGINFSPKLRFAAQSLSPDSMSPAEDVRVVNNTVVGRQGMVDYSPVRNIVPGNGTFSFPPQMAQPGQVGDNNYTPLIRLANAGGEVWNAPIVAGDVNDHYLNQFCNGVPEDMQEGFYSKVHDRVLAICPRESTVTLACVNGFSFSKSVLYFALDASDTLPATLDDVNYAPRLANLQVGGDDSLFSGVERFFVSTNGFSNKDLASGAPNNETHHPWRQGLSSAINGDGDPLNILGAIPTVALDYSPLWNFNLFSWTDYSIEAGIRTRMTGEFEVLGMAAAGYVTSPDGSQLETQNIVTTIVLKLSTTNVFGHRSSMVLRVTTARR
ncbi:hypothetical protein LTR37_021028 [Vermiconidia calcicola]|uniref:Uncharacterized protein n=1 Tax=Vermiconidia calcicola TaxID=1690605 RepID=A0ACC3MB19_9PEZI|nr:hypothetical protein LTR37_021028 [Vermiconidia calcicola]